MKKALLCSALLIGSLLNARAQSARVLADKIAGIVGDKIFLKSEIINYIDDIKRQGGVVPPNAECLLPENIKAHYVSILKSVNT